MVSRARGLRLEPRHLCEQERRLELREAKVEPGLAVREVAARAGPAVVVERVRPVGERLVVGDDGAALAAVQVLARLEREAPGLADRADMPTLPLREVRLAGILEHGNVPRGGRRHDRVHVGHRSAEVDRQDQPRLRRDRRGDLPGVDLERLDVGVHEHGERVQHEHRVDRGDEGVGRHDHLVARADAHGRERGEQRRRAVGRRQAVLRARRRGVLGFEGLHLAADTAPPLAALEHGDDRLLLAGVLHRPVREGRGAHRRAAKDGRLETRRRRQGARRRLRRGTRGAGGHDRGTTSGDRSEERAA